MRGFLFVALLICCTACASTQKVEVGSTSRFLEDVKGKLKPGSETQAGLVYVAPDANLGKYSKIIIDSLRFITVHGSGLQSLTPEERKILADYAYRAFYDELSKDYQILQKADPEALRIQLAITDAEQSALVLDTITTYIPQGRLLAGLSEVITGEPPFVGKLVAEGRVIDSMSGRLLIAGADGRSGAKDFSGTFDSWGDVEKALQFFAKRFHYNLCKGQGRTGCVAPE